MAGSSGFHWAREARRAGLISRRRLTADAFVNLRFRLNGSTDAGADRVRERVGALIAGRRVLDFQRLSPRVPARVLPRLYPQMRAVAPGAPGARPRGLPGPGGAPRQPAPPPAPRARA